MSTALPRPNPFNRAHKFSYGAYSECFDLESRHAVVKNIEAHGLDFASGVVRCPNDEALQALANLYKNHFIRCFLSHKGRIPTPTHHPSVPLFDAKKVECKSLSAEAPKNHSEAKERALTRDSYYCVLTGKLDDGKAATTTRAAYIFDLSTNEDLNPDNKQESAASVQAMLDRFGQIRTADELNDTNIRRLENILTRGSTVHDWFNQMKVWLDRNPDISKEKPPFPWTKTDLEFRQDPVNCYRPAATKPYYLREIHAQVQLNTLDASKCPLPDPRYLALHAACARVAHLSGAAEYIAMVFRDMEGTKVIRGRRRFWRRVVSCADPPREWVVYRISMLWAGWALDGFIATPSRNVRPDLAGAEGYRYFVFRRFRFL